MVRLLQALLAINLLLLPGGCLALVLLTGPWNPMLGAFITDIHVRNETAEPISVTPIGTVGPAGLRSPLPVYKRQFPAFDSPQRGGFLVPPSQSIVVYYDWDDINLSEIVIEDASGQLHQMVVDPNPTQNQYRQPSVNSFVIDGLATLDPVPPAVFIAFQEAQNPVYLWPVVSALLIPWLTFGLLLWAYRRRRPNQSLQLAGRPSRD